MTDEELRDEVLALFEEKEEELLAQEEFIKKIEEEAMMIFERKCIAIKNRLIEDVTIPDEDLESKYIEEIEGLRKTIFAEVEKNISDYVRKISEKESTST